ncbi:DUF177 domain-containing protein [Sphingomonas donggukensis]|uniref:DUF177 domain-containing protein n=1 Tax=Sphingomonas donggukensis TaxID=2949093 RepID=A0ABY4TYJ8_9SPHN|nr:YceD family protein [Sphingomonas donggukensis]URW75621.1 DUF177 domain-containing protein [Sphingomonas donggukensis]
MTEAYEFSRPRRLDTLGEGEAVTSVEADAGERVALARRFGLIALEALTADYSLRRDAAGITATGTLGARVVQACIATGDPVPDTIAEDFRIRFLPESAEGNDDEVELDSGDLDTMFYAGSAIDLGEAAAETLALALDPYPRSPRAADALRDAGVMTEEEAKPAGALAGLKDLLKGQP